MTGANRGIGKATALGLARAGGSVILVCRDPNAGEQALAEIRQKTGNQRVSLATADLSHMDSVRELAAEIKRRHRSLHVLINNAAVLPRQREVTADGLERQFATNHLACFLLTRLLLERLKESAPSRIINVSSGAHTRAKIDFDDLQSERDYRPTPVYSVTKLMNVLFTYELSRRLEGTGVTANCLHPGVISTGLLANFLGLPPPLRFLTSLLFKKPEKGAVNSLHVATAPELEHVTGQYFESCKAVPSSSASHDEVAAARLWEVSEKLVGLSGAA